MEKVSKIIKEGRKASILVKILMISILVIVLLIPVQMIASIIAERAGTYQAAMMEMVQSWGGQPVVTGPVLNVPYLEWIKDKDDKLVKQQQTAHFFPDTLQITGKVATQPLHRGIYEVTLFTADLQLNGLFSYPDFSEWDIHPGNILWDKAFLAVEMPDLRALKNLVVLSWGGDQFPFKADSSKLGIFNGALTTRLPLLNPEKKQFDFAFNLEINGGESLEFIPAGRETTVNLTSTWPSPGFTGAYLPSDREINANRIQGQDTYPDGFRADWYIPALSRNYPQQWRNKDINFSEILNSAFGVNLLIPVHTYLKSTRALKYAVLFILLPFVMFFLFEVFTKRPVHPLQYLLVGFAVCLFYLLLLSFAEQIPFNIAYLAAAGAVVALVGFYAAAVLKSRKNTLLLVAVMILLYIFLFIVLLSEDYALLIGTIGIFTVLAVFMLFTRKIDWYGVAKIKKVDEETEKQTTSD